MKATEAFDRDLKITSIEEFIKGLMSGIPAPNDRQAYKSHTPATYLTISGH